MWGLCVIERSKMGTVNFADKLQCVIRTQNERDAMLDSRSNDMTRTEMFLKQLCCFLIVK